MSILLVLPFGIWALVVLRKDGLHHRRPLHLAVVELGLRIRSERRAADLKGSGPALYDSYMSHICAQGVPPSS